MPAVLFRGLYVVSFCDPAPGTTQQIKVSGLSRAAVVTIGQDEEERVFILEAIIRRLPVDRLIETIFATQAKWKPVKFGIDATGPQRLFYEMMLREGGMRGIRIHWQPVTLHADKTFSIESTLQPVIAAGRLFRPPEAEVIALKDEFEQFPAGEKRDGLDALSCAVRLLPHRMPEAMRQMSRHQLERYLKNTGMAPEQINERLRQHDELQPNSV